MVPGSSPGSILALSWLYRGSILALALALPVFLEIFEGGSPYFVIRVATARRNHSIAGQKRALPDPERVSLSEAARICGVSHHTIRRLVEAGLLKREQVIPRAPWEIRRSDLDAAPIRGIVERLHRTGKLILQGGRGGRACLVH
jgi:hypothetical protein